MRGLEHARAPSRPTADTRFPAVPSRRIDQGPWHMHSRCQHQCTTPTMQRRHHKSSPSMAAEKRTAFGDLESSLVFPATTFNLCNRHNSWSTNQYHELTRVSRTTLSMLWSLCFLFLSVPANSHLAKVHNKYHHLNPHCCNRNPCFLLPDVGVLLKVFKRSPSIVGLTDSKSGEQKQRAPPSSSRLAPQLTLSRKSRSRPSGACVRRLQISFLCPYLHFPLPTAVEGSRRLCGIMACCHFAFSQEKVAL